MSVPGSAAWLSTGPDYDPTIGFVGSLNGYVSGAAKWTFNFVWPVRGGH